MSGLTRKEKKFPEDDLKKKDGPGSLLQYIDENIIGKGLTFAGPFGRRQVIHCDYAATAQSLRFVEDYIVGEVLPFYGDTHFGTTITSMQSALFRHEAVDLVRKSVNASDEDLVFFTSNGGIGALRKLIKDLSLPQSPIVFVGPTENSQDLLPWSEVGAKIVRISETKDGVLDLVHLESQLHYHQQLPGEKFLIGCFAAASPITGILIDEIATTLLLHQYGALVFWDYSMAAPYVPLDMNRFIPGIKRENADKDAMFVSVDKFVGGVQTPGLLVAKKKLFRNPDCGEGGSMYLVARNGHRYMKSKEPLEESDGAGIIESVRAGLVFQLKQQIGTSVIMVKQEEIVKMVLSHIRTIPEVILLGNTSQTMERLAVFSMMVRHPRGAFLHHNFVCAVLNDMFGIQARGVFAYAGSNAQYLMGVDQDLAQRYENVLMEGDGGGGSNYEVLRPGYARISLPFFIGESEVAFVLEALKMVATEGWKLLPQYVLVPETGEWRHHSSPAYGERKWLSSVTYAGGRMTYNERKVSGVTPCPKDFGECLHIARNTFNKARKFALIRKLMQNGETGKDATNEVDTIASLIHQHGGKMAEKTPRIDQSLKFEGELNSLRWFMLPSEAQFLLLGHSQRVKQEVPFQPISSLPAHFSRHNSLTTLDNNGDRRITGPKGSKRANQLSVLPHARERCHSLGSPLVPDPPSPLTQGRRSRQISCGSQTDISNCDASQDDPKSSPTHVLTRSTEELHAYLQGVTKELATEIKSELREVIAQVEDVLSDTEYNPNTEKRNSIDSLKLRDLTTSSPSPTQISSSDCTRVHTLKSRAELMFKPGDLFSEYKEMVGAADVLTSSQDGNPEEIPESNKDGNEANWCCPPKNVWKLTHEATFDYEMLLNDDRILIYMSGGLESLCLLHTLHQYQHYCASKGLLFDLGAAIVDPLCPSHDLRPLTEYLKSLEVEYFYKVLNLSADEFNRRCASFSKKITTLCGIAQKNNYNVLAIGDHLDDFVEKFLISTFHNGRLKIMKPQEYIKSNLRMIRPFVYIRERLLQDFAETHELDCLVTDDVSSCIPISRERLRVKKLLEEQEELFPNIFGSILTATRPLMGLKDSYLDIFRKPTTKRLLLLNGCKSTEEYTSTSDDDYS